MDPQELRGLTEAYAEVYAPQEELDEVSYSAKAARAGKDIGKPGKMFAKIAKSAAKRYGSEERGKKVAGAVLAKLRSEEIEVLEDMLDEAVKGASRHDTEMRKAAASERRSGIKPLPAKEGEKYAKYKMAQMDYVKRKKMGEEVSVFDVVLEFLQAEGFAETLEEAEWLMANVIDEEAIGIILGEAEIMKFQKEKGDIEARMDSNKRRRSKTSPYYTAPTKGAQGADYRRRHNIAPTKLRSGSLPEEYVDEAEKPFPYEKVKAKQVALRDKGGNALDRRMRMGTAVRRAKEAEKTGGSQQTAGAGWYHAKEDYVNEAQAARENPEKYEREQSKKYAPVRGEKTPMPPRGDKRREDFEKWYAKQMGR